MEAEQAKGQRDEQLELKLKPWERNYMLQINNRMRGAQSVTTADSKVLNYQSSETPEYAKHPGTGGANSSMYRKYARSLRRSTQQSHAETMLIQASLNDNRSLPPLRDQQYGPATVSERVGHPEARIRQVKKSMVQRATVGLVNKSAGSPQESADKGPNEYNENILVLPPKFIAVENGSTQSRGRYKAGAVSVHDSEPEMMVPMTRSSQVASPRDYATLPMSATAASRTNKFQS